MEVHPKMVSQEQLNDTEPLFFSDYHEIFHDFGSRGGCVWTTGNIIVAVASVKSEFPVLALTLNETHSEIATHFVDRLTTNSHISVS